MLISSQEFTAKYHSDVIEVLQYTLSLYTKRALEIANCRTQAGIGRQSVAKHLTQSWSLELKLIISTEKRENLGLVSVFEIA